jgi:hypothetical protein
LSALGYGIGFQRYGFVFEFDDRKGKEGRKGGGEGKAYVRPVLRLTPARKAEMRMASKA